MPLFNHGAFTLHSGGKSSFLIDCGQLSSDDLAALAIEAKNILPPFGSVEGVPEGGLRFSYFMRPHVTHGGPLLIVDDVLTTGTSMAKHKDGRPAIGLVIFSRGHTPCWVTHLFRMGP